MIHGETRPKRQHGTEILRIRLHVNHIRIVLRHINHVGLCRHDANDGLFLDDLLLRSVGKVARGNCLRPKSLDGIHDICRLIKKSLAQSRRPLEVLVHPFQNIRIAYERLDTVVPRLVRDLRWIAIRSDVARCKHHIGGQGRSGQDQGNKCVRIEGDRGEKCIEFFWERVAMVRSVKEAPAALAGGPGPVENP